MSKETCVFCKRTLEIKEPEKYSFFVCDRCFESDGKPPLSKGDKIHGRILIAMAVICTGLYFAKIIKKSESFRSYNIERYKAGR